MSDINNIRAQMAEKNRRDTGGQKLFIILLLAIPVLGLAAGFGWNMLSRQSASSPQSASAENIEQPARERRLSAREKWILNEASRDMNLTIALGMKEDFPEVMQINLHRAVVTKLMKCMINYPDDDSFPFVMTYYADINQYKYEQAESTYERAGAKEAFLQVLQDDAKKKAMKILVNPAYVNEIFAEVAAMLDTSEYEARNGPVSEECLIVKTLAQQAKLNL